MIHDPKTWDVSYSGTSWASPWEGATVALDSLDFKKYFRGFFKVSGGFLETFLRSLPPPLRKKPNSLHPRKIVEDLRFPVYILDKQIGSWFIKIQIGNFNETKKLPGEANEPDWVSREEFLILELRCRFRKCWKNKFYYFRFVIEFPAIRSNHR